METSNSGVLLRGPGTVGKIRGFNAGNGPVWIMVFDAVEVPPDGTEPILIIEAQPKKLFGDPAGVNVQNGAVWAISGGIPEFKFQKHLSGIWLRMNASGSGSGDSMDTMSRWLEILTDPTKFKKQMDSLLAATKSARDAISQLAQDKAEFGKLRDTVRRQELDLTKQTYEALKKKADDELDRATLELKNNRAAFEKARAAREAALDEREKKIAEREKYLDASITEYNEKKERMRELVS